jgi:hypothetical protein
MALADWLNPATPQPTYLTSRAAGVVVPEFYKAASEVRKNAMAMASDEQSLRLREEDAQRARDAEARRKSEEAATAAVMPRLTQLDPTKPGYFQEVGKLMAEPGGANALASQSVRSYLDIAGGARTEQQRLDAEARTNKERLAEEERNTAREVSREERLDSRGSLEGAEKLAQKYAEDLQDDDFMPAYTAELNKIRESQKSKPTEVPSMLATLTEKMTRDRNQRAIKKDLIDSGMAPDQVEKLREKDGKFGDLAKSKIGLLKQRVSSNQILSARIRVLQSEMENEIDRDKQKVLLGELKALLQKSGAAGDDGSPDAGSRYITPPAAGGAPAPSKGDNKGP